MRFEIGSWETEEVEVRFRAGHIKLARHIFLDAERDALQLLTAVLLRKHRWSAAEAALSIIESFSAPISMERLLSNSENGTWS